MSLLQLLKNKIRTLFLSFVFPFLLIPAIALAQAKRDPQGRDIEGLIERAGNIINFLLTMAVIVAFIAIVIAGYQYIASYGSAEAMQKAKTNLTYIIVGLIIIILAKALVIFVLSALGINYSYLGL